MDASSPNFGQYMSYGKCVACNADCAQCGMNPNYCYSCKKAGAKLLLQMPNQTTNYYDSNYWINY